MSDAAPEQGNPRDDSLRELAVADTLTRISKGIAHEICNPLSQITLAADLLGGQRPLTDERRSQIAKVLHQASQRIDRAVTQLQQACSPLQEAMEVLDSGPLLQGTLSALKLPAHLSLVAEIPTQGLPRIKANAKYLGIALRHLLDNAIEAMPKVGRLTLRASTRQIGQSQRGSWQQSTSLNAGDLALCIEICDSGPGIPTQQLHLIFEPFFSTKPAGQGSGLGLAAARKIISLHEGQLDIANLPQGGVCATILLKALNQA